MQSSAIANCPCDTCVAATFICCCQSSCFIVFTSRAFICWPHSALVNALQQTHVAWLLQPRRVNNPRRPNTLHPARHTLVIFRIWAWNHDVFRARYCLWNPISLTLIAGLFSALPPFRGHVNNLAHNYYNRTNNDNPFPIGAELIRRASDKLIRALS